MSQTISYQDLVSIMFKYFNKYRENPQLLLSYLQDRVSKYNDDKQYRPFGNKALIIKTEEGVTAVSELMFYLRSLPESTHTGFTWSKQLHCAANKKAEIISAGGTEAEYMPLESLVYEYGDWSGRLSEHVLYGFCDPREILIELLIEDGNLQKDNRKQFFQPDFKHIGIGIERHEKYKIVVVFILATKVYPKPIQQSRPHNPQLQSSVPKCRCNIC